MATITIGANTTNNFSGVEDTHLLLAAPTTNYGAAATLQISKYEAGDHTHMLIRFPGLSNIPPSAIITDATLYLLQSGGTGTYEITAKRLMRVWVVGQTTWNIWSTGNNWATGGALSEPNDRSATETFSVSVNAVAEWKSFTSAQLITDIQNFVSGTWTNDGWHLARDDAGNDYNYKQFRASEANDGDRPYLSVTYTEAGGVGSYALDAFLKDSFMVP